MSIPTPKKSQPLYRISDESINENESVDDFQFFSGTSMYTTDTFLTQGTTKTTNLDKRHRSSWDPVVAQFVEAFQSGTKFLWKNYLVLGSVFFVMFGFIVPASGIFLDGLPVIEFALVIIFFISGLKMKTDEVRDTFRVWKALLYGLVAILLITPLLAFAVIDLPFNMPKEFLIGLSIFCCTPTTLTSGVILTKEAYGNIALALTLCVVTNLAAVFTVPFTIPLVLKQGYSAGDNVEDIDIGTVDMLLQLGTTILAPLIVGKLCQEYSKNVRRSVDRNPKILKFISCTLLFLIPWTKISTSVNELKMVSINQLLEVFAMGFCVHVIYLTFNYCMTIVLQIPLSEKKAVVIMCSEKTLPVAFTVVSVLPDSLSTGLVAIPIIISHITQIIIDAAVAQRWANIKEEEDEAAENENLLDKFNTYNTKNYKKYKTAVSDASCIERRGGSASSNIAMTRTQRGQSGPAQTYGTTAPL